MQKTQKYQNFMLIAQKAPKGPPLGVAGHLMKNWKKILKSFCKLILLGEVKGEGDGL